MSRLCELLDNQVKKIDERNTNLVRLEEDILNFDKRNNLF
jgi:hypothetical protein